MAGRFGAILNSLSLAAGQSVRRNAGDTAFEAFTPLTGITIGNAITSGTNNRVLYQASGNLAQSANLTFDGSILGVTGTLKLLNSTKHAEIALDASYNLIFGHAYAASDNIVQYEFKYYGSGGYGTRGLKISDVGNGFAVVLNAISGNSLYLTNTSGTAVPLTLGTWTNPADASTFNAESGNWRISAGNLDVAGSKFRLRTSNTPASAAASGNQGDICWDSSYLYVCTATNTWKRAAIATW